MSNRVIVKFSFIAAMFAFASCHNDVPGLPSSEEISGYRYCEYKNTDGAQCKSTYEISEENCVRINFLNDTAGFEEKRKAVLFCDSSCDEDARLSYCEVR